jgi:histidyl-tRNA synthetase
MQKPTLAKGTRDFGPLETQRRKYLFSILAKHFTMYGFSEMETPAMENLSTLSGKYGDEGDTLLFKILNSGDYLQSVKKSVGDKVNVEDIHYHDLLPMISEKGLRYDLTVPFARFVVMNRHLIKFPFRRFQMQPVWRADKPQKGRYREFYQCDADIIGSNSLINEAELIGLISDVFQELNIPDVAIHLNHRKILEGVAESIGAKEKFTDLTTAMDKFDKTGWEGVEQELIQKGFNTLQLRQLQPFLLAKPLSNGILVQMKEMLKGSETGLKGVEELSELLQFAHSMGNDQKMVFDGTLARGLSYYTGCIMEVKLKEAGMGSIAAGGRYDNLTGIFGLKDVSGVGISFGAERIFDLMVARNLFPDAMEKAPLYLICPLQDHCVTYALEISGMFRSHGMRCMVYPGASKLKKQLDYANAIQAGYAVLIGEEELQSRQISVKDLHSGQQQQLEPSDYFHSLQS